MKRFITYIMVVVSILMTSCNKDADLDTTMEAGEGRLVLDLSSLSGDTRSTTESVLSNSVLKIYDATTSSLIRRYEPATETPSEIFILEGDYYVTVLAGDSTEATFDYGDVTFFGEERFTINAQKTTDLVINCPLLNNIVVVEFDDALNSNFEEGYSVSVTADNDSDITLLYERSNTGYFLLSDNTDMTWTFTGTKVIDGSQLVTSGKISAPQPQDKHTLRFNYTNFLSVSSLKVTVDTTTDNYEDSLNFKPQPKVESDGTFDIEDLLYATKGYKFILTGLNELTNGVITAGNTKITIPLTGDSVVSEDSGNLKYDPSTGELTLTQEFFRNYSRGGEQTLNITAYDVMGSDSSVDVRVYVGGVEGSSDEDYWNNTATISAIVLDESVGAVSIDYRREGDSDWIACPTTKGDGYAYTAKITPVWSESTNSAGLTVYQLKSGFSANTTFEYRLTVDGVERPVASITSGGGQVIPNGKIDLDLSYNLTCFQVNNSSGSTSWTSGNNNYSKTLCTFSSIGNEAAAYLAATEAGAVGINKLASGNMIYGTFSFSGTTGTMSFGQKFDWTARPKSLKLDYAATLGTVDYSGSQLSKGATDVALIYIAIVDWSSRHVVKAGMSDTSGAWDPESKDGLSSSEKVIGYGIIDITKSTGSTLEPLEIDIYYFDKASKPSSDNYSLVINCSTCAYGDYFVGSTTSKMWVNNFEFGYW